MCRQRGLRRRRRLATRRYQLYNTAGTCKGAALFASTAADALRLSHAQCSCALRTWPKYGVEFPELAPYRGRDMGDEGCSAELEAAPLLFVSEEVRVVVFGGETLLADFSQAVVIAVMLTG